MEDQAVECHAGYAYPQRPTALTWEGMRQQVEAVLAEWRTPQGKGFRVRTASGVFEVFYEEAAEAWSISRLEG